nr:MAG TPA: hypothetical protein [Caudoviricetes sp.]
MSVRFRCLVEFYGGLCDNHIANRSRLKENTLQF